METVDFQPSDRDALVESLVARWLELREEGTEIPVTELCAEHPECVSAVSEWLREFERTWLESRRDVPPTIDGYQITRRLGQGGMGAVYEARGKKLNRLVALKFLHKGAVSERFADEAVALARLNHDNVVRLYDFLDEGTTECLVLELVTGGTLKKRLKEGLLTSRDAALLVKKLGEGIAACHQENILHRDLKPSNILLSSSGVPKITDFGLAKDMVEGPDRTRSGAPMGTPEYMAPEQAAGQQDLLKRPTVDVYGLGAILYECLTGKPPIEGANFQEILHRVIHVDPVRPSHERRNVHRDLETICLKCLRKDPAKRYPSAQELVKDLDRFLNHEPILARPYTRMERFGKLVRRHQLASAVLGLLALTGLGYAGIAGYVYYDNYRTTQRHNEELKTENEKTERARAQAVENAKVAQKNAMTAQANAEQADRERQKADDEKLKAHQERKKATERAIQMTLAVGQRRMEEGHAFEAFPYFVEAAALEDADSPRRDLHERRLSALLRHCPRLIQSLSGGSAIHHLEFAPDDQSLVAGTHQGKVGLWELTSGLERWKTTPMHKGPVSWATFHPSGQKILSVSDDKTACLWDALTGQPLGSPFSHRAPVMHAAFHPLKDDLFLTVSGARYATGNTQQMQMPGTTQTLFRPGPNGVMIPYTITTPGTSIPIQREAMGAVTLWSEADAEKPFKVFPQVGWINCAEFRKDGQAIALGFSSIDKGSGVAVHTLTSRGPRYRHNGQVLHVTFSPNGKHVLSSGGVPDAERGEAFILDVETNQLAVPPLKHQDLIVMAWFSPDGQRVVTASEDHSAQLWSALTGEPLGSRMGHKDRLVGAWFSPDGRRILTASKDGNARLWDGFSAQPLTPFLKHPGPVTCGAFARHLPAVALGCADGTIRVWHYLTSADETPALDHVPILPAIGSVIESSHGSVTTLRNLKTIPGRVATQVVFSANGKHLVVGSGERFVDMAPGGGGSKAVGGLRIRHASVWNLATNALVGPSVTQRLPITAGILLPEGGLAHVSLPERGIDIKSPAAVGLYYWAKKEAESWPLPANHQVRAIACPEGGGEPWIVTHHIEANAKPPINRLQLRHGLRGEEPVASVDLVDRIQDLALSADGAVLAVLLVNTDMKSKKSAWHVGRWQLRPALQLLDMTPLPFPADRVRISPRPEHLVLYHSGQLGDDFAKPLAVESSNQALLWNGATKTLHLLPHKGTILDAHFSRDGSLVVTSSQDRTARVWDTITGEAISPALEHRDEVFYADVNDAGLVVTVSRDETACLWEMRTGDRLTPPLPHPDWVLHAAFSPDSNRLATACADGCVRLWDLKPIPRSVEKWRELAHFMAGHQIDANRAFVPLDPVALEKQWNVWRQEDAHLFRPVDQRLWIEKEWHRARKSRDWWGLLTHGLALPTDRQQTSQFQLAQAYAHAEHQQWSEAEKCLANALNLGEERSLDIQQMMVILQMKMCKPDYREHCRHWAASYADTKNANLIGSTIRTLLLADDSGANFETLLPFAASQKGNGSSFLLGAIYCRLNRWEDALAALETTPTTLTELDRIYHLLFRGLAQQRTSNSDEARETLRDAQEHWHRLRYPSPLTHPYPRPLPWTESLKLSILFEEVERALE